MRPKDLTSLSAKDEEWQQLNNASNFKGDQRCLFTPRHPLSIFINQIQ